MKYMLKAVVDNFLPKDDLSISPSQNIISFMNSTMQYKLEVLIDPIKM